MIIALRKKMKSQKGFTLIELMIVIAIIGILAAIAVPRFSNATNSANMAKAQADLSTIDSAISVYLAANPGTTPTLDTGAATSLAPNYLATIPTPPTSKVTLTSGSVIDPGTSKTYTITNNRGTWGTYTSDQIK